MAVILMYPLFILPDSLAFFFETTSYYSGIAFLISLIIQAIILFALVMLGANRSRMFVPASFVLALFQAVMITVNFFIAATVYPLVDTKEIYGVAIQFPHIFYLNVFFNSTITAVCCLISARWLRDTQIKPPSRIYSSFIIVFVIFALILNAWWVDINNNMSISYWTSAFMGTLLLGVLLLLFYFYTRLAGKADKAEAVINEQGNYSQFIDQLSKRELDVVKAILAGNCSHKELAAALNISVNTVKTHLKNIYQVTGISSIAALSFLFRGYHP